MAKRPKLPPTDSEDAEEESAVETSEAESEPIAKKPAKKAAPAKKAKAALKAKTKKRADSEDNNSEEESEPAPKKRKTEKGKAKAVKESSSNEPKAENSVVQTDKEGGKYISLTDKRRATVREFKGVTYLDIREYYTKDGELLPSKKGISLNLEQWESLKEHIDTIDTLFAKKK